MVLINSRKLKVGFGYYLISSTFCLLIYIITEMVTERPIQTPIILNFMSYDQILFLNGAISFFILFFWMLASMIINKNLKYKALWILSSFVIYTAAPVFYFIFVYRKNNQQ